MHGAFLRAGLGLAAEPGGDEGAELLHAGIVRRGDIRKGEGELHLVVLHLADLAEGQKLHLVHAGMGLGNAHEFAHALLVVVQAGDGHLAERDRQAQLIEAREEFQGRGQPASHMGAVFFFRHILEVEEYAVRHGEQGFDLGVQHTAGGVETGVQSGLAALAEQLRKYVYAFRKKKQ